MSQLIVLLFLSLTFKPVWNQLDTILYILRQFTAQVNQLNATQGNVQFYPWGRYGHFNEDPTFPVDLLPGFVQPFPETEIPPPHKMAGMVERFMELAVTKVQYDYRFHLTKDPYAALYDGKIITSPVHLIKHWHDDEEFARQYIQGIHPMMIKVCQSEEEIPIDMRNLKAQNKGINELIWEKRLFMADYKILADIPLHLNFKFYAPIVLLYKHLPTNELPQDGPKLMVLGIQLTRKEKNNVVYTPKSPPYRYLFAKIHVASADAQLHHIVIHLGFTHLYVEPFIIAYNNHLRMINHTLTDLLEPHMFNTIFMNYLGRLTLIALENATTNDTLSVGTVNSLKLFLKVFANSTFFDRSFINELKSRGFNENGDDQLENYYYRDDGFKIWNAIYNYVKAFVFNVYPSDAAVAQDEALQQFATSISDPEEGKIVTFPRRIISRKILTDCLAIYIFTTSAHHSAIGLPQQPYNGFIPNRPQTLINFMPEGEGDINITFIYQSLPDAKITQFQFLIAHFLSLRSERTLTRMTNLKNVFPDIHNNFQTVLYRISSDIQERNKRLQQEGKVPYIYLDPQYVAASADI